MSSPNLHSVDWTQIPAPTDDGAAHHLEGSPAPSVPLQATDDAMVDLSKLEGRAVVYAYPITGQPGVSLPAGWDALPGARGCTPQSCAFRDHFNELQTLGVVHLFGLSTQPTTYQREAVERLHLPFPLLSDEKCELADALSLPTFEVEGRRLLKRLTMILDHGAITRVFYPVFPPDRNAGDVLAWLAAHQQQVGPSPRHLERTRC